MKLRSPRHIYESLLNKERAPDSESERSLFVLLHGTEALNKLLPHKPWTKGAKVDPSISYPYSIFSTPQTRAVMEAFLLATTDDYDVAEAVAMAPEEITTYRQLFFDTSVFKSDLEIIVFIREIPDEDPYKDLYKVSFHQGFKALRWQFCRGDNKGSVSPEEVIRTQMLDAHFRALEHRGRKINGEISKEAKNYAKFAMSCAKMLHTVYNEGNGEEGIADLKIRFEKVGPNPTINDLQHKGAEVLH